VHRALGCSVLLAILIVTGCGSSAKSKRRDAVNAYLSRVQTIQLHFRPSFDLANQAYRDFSKGKTGKRQVERLRGAEVSILAARDALDSVSPPEDARKLHAELLQLYDLNASLGLEVITLQRFLPAVHNVLGNLAGVNKSYQQNLSGSRTATAQADALDGYSGAVRRVVDRFRRLGPPPALRPWQQAQLLRLQQIVDTGHTLATASRARDRNATAPLIKRFRFLLSHQPNVSQAQHNAVKAYDNRLVGISKLQGTIAREHQRLQNLLG
jgi:hypothetical protein